MPTWRQHAWAAVLYAGPAALCMRSALPDSMRKDADGEVVHVAIDTTRRVARLPGVVVHRVRDLDRRALWNTTPPRLRLEEVVLDLADRARSERDIVRLVTEAVGSRQTTADRLIATLGERRRFCRRAFLSALLADVRDGACSVLEHNYLTRVERAHGLPKPSRQQTRHGPRGKEYRDVEYAGFGLVVELDGAAFHTGFDVRDLDADRDLDDQAAGKEVVRVRWVQVESRRCATASRIARILRRRGWTGKLTRCGPDCTV